MTEMTSLSDAELNRNLEIFHKDRVTFWARVGVKVKVKVRVRARCRARVRVRVRMRHSFMASPIGSA